MKRFKKILLWTNLIFLAFSILTLFSYGGMLNMFPKLYILNIISPLVFIINLVFAGTWLFIERKRSLYSAVFLAVSMPLWSSWISVPKFASNDIEVGIKLVSYNVQVMGKNLPGNKADDYGDSIISFLDETNAELICLQEFYTNDSKRSRDYLARMKSLGYSHKWAITYQKGEARWSVSTFSKLEIVDAEFVEVNDQPFAVATIVAAKIDTFAILNVHLNSNRFNRREISNIESLGQGEVANSREIGAKLYHAFRTRQQQVDSIIAWKERQVHPMIICGDFNDGPLSYTYRRIKGSRIWGSGLSDAFLRFKSGIGSTYNGKIPFQRIDHILCSRSIDLKGYQRIKIPYSDHFPIAVSFEENF